MGVIAKLYNRVLSSLPPFFKQLKKTTNPYGRTIYYYKQHWLTWWLFPVPISYLNEALQLCPISVAYVFTLKTPHAVKPSKNGDRTLSLLRIMTLFLLWIIQNALNCQPVQYGTSVHNIYIFITSPTPSPTSANWMSITLNGRCSAIMN